LNRQLCVPVKVELILRPGSLDPLRILGAETPDFAAATVVEDRGNKLTLLVSALCLNSDEHRVKVALVAGTRKSLDSICPNLHFSK
jgi:hypothetical protein